MPVKYRKIEKPEGAENWRWDVPQHNQGQIVTVAYNAGRPQRTEACHGDKYQRVHDASDNTTDYYQRVDPE